MSLSSVVASLSKLTPGEVFCGSAENGFYSTSPKFVARDKSAISVSKWTDIPKAGSEYNCYVYEPEHLKTQPKLRNGPSTRKAAKLRNRLNKAKAKANPPPPVEETTTKDTSACLSTIAEYFLSAIGSPSGSSEASREKREAGSGTEDAPRSFYVRARRQKDEFECGTAEDIHKINKDRNLDISTDLMAEYNVLCMKYDETTAKQYRPVESRNCREADCNGLCTFNPTYGPNCICPWRSPFNDDSLKCEPSKTCETENQQDNPHRVCQINYYSGVKYQCKHPYILKGDKCTVEDGMIANMADGADGENTMTFCIKGYPNFIDTMPTGDSCKCLPQATVKESSNGDNTEMPITSPDSECDTENAITLQGTEGSIPFKCVTTTTRNGCGSYLLRHCKTIGCKGLCYIPIISNGRSVDALTQCYCPPGEELHVSLHEYGKEATCKPYNACEQNADPCSHTCTVVGTSSYECECPAGFVLAMDNRNCDKIPDEHNVCLTNRSLCNRSEDDKNKCLPTDLQGNFTCDCDEAQYYAVVHNGKDCVKKEPTTPERVTDQASTKESLTERL
eukprot:GHVQ01022326.1.p1 GENE.GHVQ01022326.1~~GHVQ01022326.1.p1  ORF type:complete len:563 (-),score=48.98 GHVQ01022326.1:2621-4309(-)